MAKNKAKAGAPRVNNGLFQKARASVNASGRDMERVRELGYTHLDTAIARLYRNLRTTQNGLGKNMTGGNQRNLDRILRRTALSRKMNRRVTQTGTRDIEALGDSQGIMGQELGRLTKDLGAAGRGADRMAGAGADTGRLTSKTAEGVMGIIQSGANEAQGHANVLASEALSRRTSDDLALIAQQKHDIAMAQLQAKVQARAAEQELANAKKLAAYNHTLATEGLDPTNKQAVSTAVHELVNAGQLIRDLEQGGADAATIMAQLLGAGGIYADASPAEKSAIQRMIVSLTSKTSPAGTPDDWHDEVADIVATVPGWENLGKKKREYLKGLIGAEASMASATKTATLLPSDAEADGPVGTSYTDYRKAQVEAADSNLTQPEEARDTTINWFRSNAIAALQKAMPGLSDDRAAQAIEDIIRGHHWSNTLPSIGRELPALAQSAVKAVFAKLPKGNSDYGQGVFISDDFVGGPDYDA